MENPPIYPHEGTEFCDTGNINLKVTKPGLLLRDHIAITAMPEILRTWRGSRPFDFEWNGGDAENIADACYRLADEMLKRRQKI